MDPTYSPRTDNHQDYFPAENEPSVFQVTHDFFKPYPKFLAYATSVLGIELVCCDDKVYPDLLAACGPY